MALRPTFLIVLYLATAGSYSAKWRRDDGAWRLEAEIFSTESCGGTYCPEAR